MLGFLKVRLSPILFRISLTDASSHPGTFVTPTGTNAPSFFKEFGVAFQMLKKRVKFRFRDRISLLALKWSSPQGKRWYHRSLKLTNSKIAPTAVALHRQMYSDFAAGDTAALRKICLDGINDSFRARIGARARGEKVVWELVKYNGRARVISNRGARLPFDGVAIRQAVVRIASRQKLTRWAKGKSGSLEIVPGSGKEKDVVEYVVVQQKFENWKGGSWQVWGTTTETTPENVVQWETKELA